jgi:hypothetical protein
MTTTAGASLAIEALGLGKAFGAIKAVDGLDLSVPRGGVFALLGPERRRQPRNELRRSSPHRALRELA